MPIGNWQKSALGLALAVSVAFKPADRDPYLWLSDIHGAKALAWVGEQSAKSNAVLTRDPRYAEFRDEIVKSLDVKDRIPFDSVDHGDVYDFWQDADHVRGLWRRTSVTGFRGASPNWDVLLDVDKYDAQQHKNWVFHGANCAPGMRHCLIDLSPDGGDAGEIFEFDPTKHAFMRAGFHLTLAKSTALYIDDDTILFGTDFGPGTLTQSGYPRIVKIWHRGTPIAQAKTVYEAMPRDIEAQPVVWRGPYGTVALIERGLTFFTSEFYLVLPDRSTRKLPLPVGANLQGVTDGQLVFTLRDDWQERGRLFKQGSLLAFDLEAFAKMDAAKVALLYAPGPPATLSTIAAGRDRVYAAVFDNIVGSIHALRPQANGTWSDTKLALPQNGTTEVASADAWTPEAYFTFESFLVPPTLYDEEGDGRPPAAIKSQKPLFDANRFVAQQYWVKSNDGVAIPYFFVRAKAAKGTMPTILYAYGGFELSLFPWYWNDGHRPLDAGQVWLPRGGAIPRGNIPGGGGSRA